MVAIVRKMNEAITMLVAMHANLNLRHFANEPRVNYCDDDDEDDDDDGDTNDQIKLVHLLL